MRKLLSVVLMIIGIVIALIIQGLTFAIPSVLIEYAIVSIPSVVAFLTVQPSFFAWMLQSLINILLYGVSAFVTDRFITFFFRKRAASDARTARIVILIRIGLAAFGAITLPSESLTMEGFILAASVFIPSYAFLKPNRD